MKALQYTFLAICTIVELVLLIFGIMGFTVYAGDPDPNVPIAMIAAVAVCALTMLGITIRSFIRLSKNRENPVLIGFLFKFPLMIFTLGLCWFALDIPEAGWIAMILSIPLGALIIFMPRIMEKNKIQAQRKRPVSAAAQFTKDKAEWAWEAAASEYLRTQVSAADARNMAKEFTDKENEKIFAYAGTPIAYFLGWLVKRDLISEEFRETCGALNIRDLKAEEITPVEFLAAYMDYVLARDDIAPEARRFVDLYYRDDTNGITFSHRSKRYFFDYYKAVCSTYETPRYYCVDFTWESFHRLAEILDLRYRAFNREDFDEETTENSGTTENGGAAGNGGLRLQGQYFDTEAKLFVEPGTSSYYSQKCADAFTNMSEGLQREIADCMIEYYTETAPEDPSVEWILSHFSPSKVVVFKPDAGLCGCKTLFGELASAPPFGSVAGLYGKTGVSSGSVASATLSGSTASAAPSGSTTSAAPSGSTASVAPSGSTAKVAPSGSVAAKDIVNGGPRVYGSTAVPAYVVRGESEWDPEHGISFTVIGDHVVDFGGYADSSSPCEEDLQWRYRILEDASRGNYCKAEVIPARFGGRKNSADNQVLVPKAAAALKEHCEDYVEALYIMKQVEHYDCKITYHEGKPNFLFLEATAGDRRTFRDSIALGF